MLQNGSGALPEPFSYMAPAGAGRVERVPPRKDRRPALHTDEDISVIDSVALILFPALMAYSALSDLFTMRIANWISACLIVAFVVLAAISGMSVSSIAIDHLSCGLAVLALTFALFAFRWIGGGDAKLAAATAVWVGWEHIADYGLLASLIGAALTFAILFFRKSTLPRWASSAWISRLHDKAAGVPYGIALACAGLVLYPETTVWHAVVGA